MKELILKAALPLFMSILTEMMSPENFKKYGLKAIAFMREFVLDSETKVDDTIALPILNALEKMLGWAD